jgi:hypothetical protein
MSRPTWDVAEWGSDPLQRNRLDERRVQYTPTGEWVRVLRVANEGQQQPGDPGRGERLYAVEAVNRNRLTDSYAVWQASPAELREVVDGKLRPYVHDRCPCCGGPR